METVRHGGALTDMSKMQVQMQISSKYMQLCVIIKIIKPKVKRAQSRRGNSHRALAESKSLCAASFLHSGSSTS